MTCSVLLAFLMGKEGSQGAIKFPHSKRHYFLYSNEQVATPDLVSFASHSDFLVLVRSESVTLSTEHLRELRRRRVEKRKGHKGQGEG